MASEGDTVSNRHYRRPPIVEALINIQVAYANGLSENLIKRVEDHFGPKFKHQSRIGGVSVSFGTAAAPVTAQQMHGARFANDSNNKILQIRPEGFTYSHLSPYSRWDELRGEAEPLWRDFIELCKPDRVFRIAVKFINKLNLPQRPNGNVSLADYLTFNPQTPIEFETITGFMTQVQLPQPELAGQQPLALVTVASQPPVIPNMEAVVLDIDVFQMVSWAADDEKIWSEIEKMRAIKNRIFEAACKDRLKEMFT